MQHAFVVFAVRLGYRKKIPCISARAAIEQRNLFNRKGWGVSISDHHGMPVSDATVNATAIFEARSDL